MKTTNWIKTSLAVVSILGSIVIKGCSSAPKSEKHLFILSGQSNMVRMDENITFRPTLNAAFGAENVVIVKDAMGSQSIRRWIKDWQATTGKAASSSGDLYERLMSKVTPQLQNQQFDSVTLLWMQGERDAREGNGDVYQQTLNTLIAQLEEDTGYQQINAVIGRLSDFGFNKSNFPDWQRVRKAQMDFAASSENYRWVDTDTFNEGVNSKGKTITNDIHYSVSGYQQLGQAFADQAIELIEAGAEAP